MRIHFPPIAHLLMATIVAAAVLPTSAPAATVSAALAFGGGAPVPTESDYSSSDTYSLGLATVTTYVDPQVHSGSAALSHQSQIQADFPAALPAPGLATIGLTQIPTSSGFEFSISLTGIAGITVDPFIGSTVGDEVSLGSLSLNASGTGDGMLGPSGDLSGSGSGTFTPAPTLGISGVLAVSLDMDINLTIDIGFDSAIMAQIMYRHVDSGTMWSQNVLISGTTNEIEVDLPLAGQYEFSLVDMILPVEFDALVAVDAMYTGDILGFEFGPTLSAPSKSIYGGPVPLLFPASGGTEANFEGWFAVEVIPEPSTLILFILGALSWCCRGFRRKSEGPF